MNECIIDTESMSSIYKTIGLNVKRIRMSKKITQLQLALAIKHKAVGTISMCELCINGKHFNIEQLSKISQVLNIPISEFFVGVDDMWDL